MRVRNVIAIIVVLVVIAGIMGVGYYSSSLAMTNYAGQLEGVYQQSFFDLVNNINDIEVNLSKALVTTTKIEKEKIYYKLYEQANQAQSNLSHLPLTHESIKETNKFINQLSGFSYYIFDKLNSGGEINDEDYNSLLDIYDYSVYVQQVINEYTNSLRYDYSILRDVNASEAGKSNFNTTFTSIADTSVEYPTLIYDGPFSDSVLNKEIKGLPTNDITQEQARRIVIDKLSSLNYAMIKNSGESSGKFETYNFILTKSNGDEIYVQVTKKGGMILQISSYEGVTKSNLNYQECVQKAEEFALSLGFENLKAVWGTIISNVAYINLTTVINETIIYPEMIKVKISLQTGNILGWEARSYAYNHTDRTISNANVSLESARSNVSSLLTIQTELKCIIPLEYCKEAFCYEFKCKLNNYIYYVYIDAQTGDQVNILRVIDTNNGEMLI